MNTIEVKFLRALLAADLKASCYRIMLSLWLGQRDLTALGFHEDTLQKSIHELKLLGFVEKTKFGLQICPVHFPDSLNIPASGVLSDFGASKPPASAPVPAPAPTPQTSLFGAGSGTVDTSRTAEKPNPAPQTEAKAPATTTPAANTPASTETPRLPAIHPFLSRPAHQQRRVFEVWRTHLPRDARIGPVIDATTGAIPASAVPLDALAHAEFFARRLFGNVPAIASAGPR